jgi:hypothetical protein
MLSKEYKIKLIMLSKEYKIKLIMLSKEYKILFGIVIVAVLFIYSDWVNK